MSDSSKSDHESEKKLEKELNQLLLENEKAKLLLERSIVDKLKDFVQHTTKEELEQIKALSLALKHVSSSLNIHTTDE